MPETQTIPQAVSVDEPNLPIKSPSPTPSSTTSTNGFESPKLQNAPVQKQPVQTQGYKPIYPSTKPFVLFQSEIEKFVVKDFSIRNLNSIVGKKKRFAGGKWRVVEKVDEARIERALRLGVPVLKIAHMPRSWLRYQDPDYVQSAQPVLYAPRPPHLVCHACAERGFLCASLAPEQVCAVCHIENLKCKSHNTERHEEVQGKHVVTVPRVNAGQSSSDDWIQQAAADLAHRINKSLARRYRREVNPSRSRGKAQSPKLSHRVAYEPRKVVFDEFLRTKKERWARFGWLNGHVSYYGDSSLPHECTISSMWDMIKTRTVALLDVMPAIPPALERELHEMAQEEAADLLDYDGYQDEDDQDSFMDTVMPRSKGSRMFDLLFAGALSAAVEGLDGTLLEKPRPEVTRRSSRATTAAWTPGSRSAMTKQGDILLLYEYGLSTENVALAVEVAYCNEKLDLAMRESILWKGKAKVSIAVKIDDRIKDKRRVDWSANKERSSIDPLITMFLVRDAKTEAEKRIWGDQPVKLQLAIGRGSGIRVSQRTRNFLQNAAQNNLILERVVDAIDWDGSQAINDPEWTQTFDGFQRQDARRTLRVPFEGVLSEAINRAHNATKTDGKALSRAQKTELENFIGATQLCLSLGAIRDSVIRFCFAEFNDTLRRDERYFVSPDDHPVQGTSGTLDTSAASSFPGETPFPGLGSPSDAPAAGSFPGEIPLAGLDATTW